MDWVAEAITTFLEKHWADILIGVLVVVLASLSIWLFRNSLVWLFKRTKNLSSDQRQVFKEVLNTLSEAGGLVFSNGAVDGETLELYFKARNEARLQLPNKLAAYAQKLFDIAKKARRINDKYLYPEKGLGLPEGDKRDEKVAEHSSYIDQLLDARPDEIFAPYMKIKT